MPLLRTAAESALDAVAEECRDVADYYRTARHIAGQEPLAELFGQLEARRNAFADDLAAEIRRMGNIPDVPDADREALEHLAVRVKTLLATDKGHALIESCRKMEERLTETVEEAMQHDLPASTLQLLRRLQADGMRADAELTDANSR
jgi:uncharacterized protein (TIGR02284 family)